MCSPNDYPSDEELGIVNEQDDKGLVEYPDDQCICPLCRPAPVTDRGTS